MIVTMIEPLLKKEVLLDLLTEIGKNYRRNGNYCRKHAKIAVSREKIS
jgi:hypothetical protein